VPRGFEAPGTDRAAPARSVPELLEQAWLEVAGADPAGRGHERPNLATAHEPPPAQLDALDLACPRPATDRRRPEPDVRGGEDLRGLPETDPVGRGRRHGQPVAVSEEPELFPPLEVELVGVVEAESFDEESFDDESFDDESLDDEPSLAAPVLTAPDSLPESAFDPDFALAERSFLAQPEPLKCTVGSTNALRSVPSAPHVGQNRGPGAAMPWITSVRSPHSEHR
jgi:hypothetical protein